MAIQAVASWVASKLGRQGLIARTLRPAYEHSLAALTAGRGVAWSINGMSCRIDPRQRHRMGRDYDSPVARWLSERIKPGDLCANVGANVGVYALQCAHWNAPGGRVVAFEPNPHAREILLRHLRYNNLQDRVQVVAAAVADCEGASAFFADVTGDGMSRLGTPNTLLAAPVQILVPTVSLDGFFQRGPDWLMIDVEGMEIRVLRGARRVLRECTGIVMELHPDAWPEAGTNRGELEQLLRECSLTATPLSGQVDPLGTYGHIALEKR